MYSFFSKLFYFFLSISPLYWISILLILVQLIRRKWLKRSLSAIGVLLVLFIGNNFLMDRMLIRWMTKPLAMQDGDMYETAIVLGGFISADNRVKPMLNLARHRFDKAVELYKQGKVKKIVFTGGSMIGLQKEAALAKQMAIAAGVAEDDVFAESQSSTTYENAMFTKSILDSMHVYNHSLLISSAMHLPRAKRTFETAGVDVIELPSDYDQMNEDKNYDLSDYLFIKLNAVAKCQWLLKEMAGLAIYSLSGKS